MSTPLWVTVLVAVLSTSGALASQLLNNRRADRRAERDRMHADRRYERQQNDRARDDQRGRYARFFAAVAAVRGASGDATRELAELRLVAADLEFSTPESVQTRAREVPPILERWVRLREGQLDGSVAVVDADRQVVDRLAELRTAMQHDLDQHDLDQHGRRRVDGRH